MHAYRCSLLYHIDEGTRGAGPHPTISITRIIILGTGPAITETYIILSLALGHIVEHADLCVFRMLKKLWIKILCVVARFCFIYGLYI